MDDLKLMTVRALRELAKTHLGPGYSRLKTKAELVAALAKKLAEPTPKKAAAPEPAKPTGRRPAPKKAAAPEPARPAAKKAEPQKAPAQKPEPRAAAKPAGAVAKPAAQAPAPTEAAEAPAAEAASDTLEHRAEIRASLRPGAMIAEPAPEPPPEPLPEPAPRSVSPAEAELLAEGLGQLPWSYGDDAVRLMARDPHTLYVYWDFAEQTARRAREGLQDARAVLRLYDGGHLVREVDVALDARSWYLHHATPGRHYRAELHFVDASGRTQRVGPASNATRVPSEGPSPVVEDRFVTLPWEVPLARSGDTLENPLPGEPFSEAQRQSLLARAEEGLHQEGLRGGAPGEVELEHEVVRGLGGSEVLVERRRPRNLPGASWTSSRPG